MPLLQETCPLAPSLSPDGGAETRSAVSAQHGGRAAAKRLYDVGFAALGLALLSPLLGLLAALVKAGDGGPVFYRQRRVGRQGRPFTIWKFRTMVVNAERLGPAVTRGGDARVTRIGRLLRATKLDELPQLWNVLTGDMSLVGPRPEVPRYVERYTAAQREILELKPGITDQATLRFRGEEALLRQAGRIEDFYVRCCLPRKLALNLEYARRANVFTDTWIILQTLCPPAVGVLGLYALALAAALGLSFWVRHDFVVPAAERLQLFHALAWVVPLQAALLGWRRQGSALWGYFGLPDLRQTLIALGLAALAQLGLGLAGAGHGVPPPGVVLIDFGVAVAALTALRLAPRLRRRDSATAKGAPAAARRFAIVGAGPWGATLARELAGSGAGGPRVTAFFDDDARKWRRRLHDVPIVGMPELLAEPAWAGRVDEVLVAVPDAPPGRLDEIQDFLAGARVKFQIVPAPGSGSAHGSGGSPAQGIRDGTRGPAGRL